jgi:hypothetical protein
LIIYILIKPVFYENLESSAFDLAGQPSQFGLFII